MKSTERACPFCGRALEGLSPRAIAPMPELSRAAAVFIGATALAGCGKEPAEPKPDNTQLSAPAYGVPPQDLPPPPQPPDQNMMPVPAYGVPPADLPPPPDAAAPKTAKDAGAAKKK